MYFGSKISNAFKEVTEDMPIYKGVRLWQFLEAVYDQGLKDGARRVFEEVDKLRPSILHKNPGRPRKKPKSIGTNQ